MQERVSQLLGCAGGTRSALYANYGVKMDEIYLLIPEGNA
jgi:hypothetical protein